MIFQSKYNLRLAHAAVIIFLFILITACGGKRNVDLIIHHALIYTVNQNFDTVQAMAVKDGKILAVGSNEFILQNFQSAQMKNMEGKFIYPGFIDAHCHFFGYASDLAKCELTGTTSFDEVIQHLTEYEKTNSFSWLLGRGWDQNDWELKEYPNNKLLDSLFPNKPVYLMRIDGHAVLCNSLALKKANITTNTKISGGEILQNNGELTGILIDNAVELVKAVIPPFDSAQNTKGILIAEKNCFAAGLTTVCDAGLGKDSLALLDVLQKKGLLKMRIYGMISDTKANLDYFFERGPYKTDRMNIRAVKTYGDGALGSRGACLKQPYSDKPGHYGFLLHDESYFDRLAHDCYENDFQLCVHSIGDSTAKVMLSIFNNHLAEGNNKRWRLEHAQVMEVPERKKMKALNVIPSVQPTHATSDMYWAEERLGPDRIRFAYAYNQLLDDAGTIAFGTDFPVEAIYPINTFYAAIARKDLNGRPENGFLIENRVKRKDALKAMTINAAYSCFEESEKGSLEEGKFADFIILDSDIMEMKKDDVPQTKILSTYLNGEKVFELK